LSHDVARLRIKPSFLASLQLSFANDKYMKQNLNANEVLEFYEVVMEYTFKKNYVQFD